MEKALTALGKMRVIQLPEPYVSLPSRVPQPHPCHSLVPQALEMPDRFGVCLGPPQQATASRAGHRCQGSSPHSRKFA